MNKNSLELATKQIEFRSIKQSSNTNEVASVIVEQPIEVLVNAKKRIILFATPTNIEALVVGLLFSLKIIENAADIISLEIAEKDLLQVAVQVKKKDFEFNLQDTVISSSQGVSNIMSTNKWSKSIIPVPNKIRVDGDLLTGVMKKLHDLQKVYLMSRGAHAAGIFNDAGEIIAFTEDVGRHNALDKVIGQCLLASQSFERCGVVLTSRISFEMVAKSARAGLELILAISAPTTLAIAMSQKWSITLCGSVRDEAINVYTYPTRII
ncbi:Protein FdhD [Gammaproteobacteria bacterium]